mmetsp:Transcript_36331/g.85244  ORF Transcript_36331/g.85244 Transcript_36331/m.85244 type:complete len:225 (+) Transcript_36331:679-1353(+)
MKYARNIVKCPNAKPKPPIVPLRLPSLATSTRHSANRSWTFFCIPRLATVLAPDIASEAILPALAKFSLASPLWLIIAFICSFAPSPMIGMIAQITSASLHDMTKPIVNPTTPVITPWIIVPSPDPVAPCTLAASSASLAASAPEVFFSRSKNEIGCLAMALKSIALTLTVIFSPAKRKVASCPTLMMAVATAMTKNMSARKLASRDRAERHSPSSSHRAMLSA